MVKYIFILLSFNFYSQSVDTVKFYTETDQLDSINKAMSFKSKHLEDSLKRTGIKTFFIVSTPYDYPKQTKYYFKQFTDSVLVYEGLRYNLTPLGKCKEYYENGIIKSVKTFSEDETNSRDLNGFPVGTWYFYDTNGKLIRKEKHKK